MRDNSMLDVSALRCLPLDREKFPQDSRFAPMFDEVQQAFQDESLLPAFDGSHVNASQAKLSRTQELRDLLSPEQISALFSSEYITWLSGDITQDKAPDVLKYLTQELNIDLITPTKMVPNLSKQFLEEQPDEWVLRLYEFLNGQEAALRRYLDKIPLVRLDDGTHVLAREQGEAKAFLPSTIATGFPSVRRAVCTSTEALAFLVSLKITEPDPIDDVIRNVLPKYQQDEVDEDEGAYTADIERIRIAFNTDSTSQKEKLRTALRETSFVMVVDAGDGQRYVTPPGSAYIATERLKQLFAGVKGVFIVDDEYDCLRGEGIRELMESCGAVRYPRPLEAPRELSSDEKLELRKQTGYSTTSGANDRVIDWLLDGFDDLIKLMPTLSVEHRADRAQLLWDSLGDLEERRGRGVFDGSYTWSHYGERKTPPFPAAFLRKLNIAAWVPDSKGELVPPGLVVFDALGWKPNPFLLTKLAFKPPILDQLAKEAGIDPEALDLLRKYGITSVEELAARLGITNPPTGVEPGLDTQPDAVISPDTDVYDDAIDLYGDDMPEIHPGTLDPDGGDHTRVGAGPNGQGHAGSGNPSGGSHLNNAGGSGNHRTSGGSGNTGAGSGHSKKSPGQSGSRPFISYVGAHPGDDGSDPDGLDQAERMQIEEHAIALIIKLEPTLRRTVEGNPGFDLYTTDSIGNVTRWVEVKSMTGSLDDRPVGLSHTQFDWAREKGDAYWLYIVEYATIPSQARVLRIQNPVAHSKTFTFDRGWSQIALADPPNDKSFV